MGPTPFSPVHSARKFSAVLGTTSAKSSITSRDGSLPPMETSRKTRGFPASVWPTPLDIFVVLN
jgi:hypothetical protein